MEVIVEITVRNAESTVHIVEEHDTRAAGRPLSEAKGQVRRVADLAVRRAQQGCQDTPFIYGYTE